MRAKRLLKVLPNILDLRRRLNQSQSQRVNSIKCKLERMRIGLTPINKLFVQRAEVLNILSYMKMEYIRFRLEHIARKQMPKHKQIKRKGLGSIRILCMNKKEMANCPLSFYQFLPTYPQPTHRRQHHFLLHQLDGIFPFLELKCASLVTSLQPLSPQALFLDRP